MAAEALEAARAATGCEPQPTGYQGYDPQPLGYEPQPLDYEGYEPLTHNAGGRRAAAQRQLKTLQLLRSPAAGRQVNATLSPSRGFRDSRF